VLKREPPREEYVPSGPLFLPERPTKKRTIKLGRVLIVVLCLLGGAYALIGLAFDPLDNYLLGRLCEVIGKDSTAIKHYHKVTDASDLWAERAAGAMTRLGKRVFGKHLELHHYRNWTAKSTIVFMPADRSGRPTSLLLLESQIAYKAPGMVAEQITENGKQIGQHLVNEAHVFLSLSRYWSRSQSAAEYSASIQQVLGFGPDKLFDESGKEDVIEAFFEDVGLRLDGVWDNEEGVTICQFVIEVQGDKKLMRKLEFLSGPFYPWTALGAARMIPEVAKVSYNIRAKDGFLEGLHLTYADNTILVGQFLSDFRSDVEIPPERFKLRR